MAEVSFGHVRKDYGGATILHDFDLRVRDGERVVLVGGSGSGKSTTLRLLAGLETVSAGTIWIGPREVTHLPPAERDVAMVFQDYALYPHLTARENIAIGLRLRKLPGPEIERRVRWASETLGLQPVLDRKPRLLSGGQRQRVAMGRAMVREPAVFLFDEPLSNLDAHLRSQMRAEIARLQRRLGTTTIYVTHDQVEAMTLGDRIVVLEGGRIQQVGTPFDVYERPSSRFVAGFIGSPPMNFVEGTLSTSGGEPAFEAPGLRVVLPAGRWPATAAEGRITLGVRPEDLALASAAGPGVLSGRLSLAEVLGPLVHAHVEAGPLRWIAVLPGGTSLADEAAVHLRIDPRKAHLFDGDGTSLRR